MLRLLGELFPEHLEGSWPHQHLDFTLLAASLVSHFLLFEVTRVWDHLLLLSWERMTQLQFFLSVFFCTGMSDFHCRHFLEHLWICLQWIWKWWREALENNKMVASHCIYFWSTTRGKRDTHECDICQTSKRRVSRNYTNGLQETFMLCHQNEALAFEGSILEDLCQRHFWDR